MVNVINIDYPPCSVIVPEMVEEDDVREVISRVVSSRLDTVNVLLTCLGRLVIVFYPPFTLTLLRSDHAELLLEEASSFGDVMKLLSFVNDKLCSDPLIFLDLSTLELVHICPISDPANLLADGMSIFKNFLKHVEARYNNLLGRFILYLDKHGSSYDKYISKTGIIPFFILLARAYRRGIVPIVEVHVGELDRRIIIPILSPKVENYGNIRLCSLLHVDLSSIGELKSRLNRYLISRLVIERLCTLFNEYVEEDVKCFKEKLNDVYHIYTIDRPYMDELDAESSVSVVIPRSRTRLIISKLSDGYSLHVLLKCRKVPILILPEKHVHYIASTPCIEPSSEITRLVMKHAKLFKLDNVINKIFSRFNISRIVLLFEKGNVIIRLVPDTGAVNIIGFPSIDYDSHLLNFVTDIRPLVKGRLTVSSSIGIISSDVEHMLLILLPLKYRSRPRIDLLYKAFDLATRDVTIIDLSSHRCFVSV